MAASPRMTRRPIPSRDAPWAIRAARWLQRAGVQPNQVSVVGVVFAVITGICLVFAGRSEGAVRAALFLVAVAMMPLRLLCNLLDGMLAVEGGLQSPTGGIYNELPDRLSDLIILASAGYAIPALAYGPELGWLAAATALLTAYVRTLGAAEGTPQHFAGIMAKPRRMHVMIAASLLAALASIAGWPADGIVAAALLIIIGGGIVTIVQRLRLIAADFAAT